MERCTFSRPPAQPQEVDKSKYVLVVNLRPLDDEMALIVLYAIAYITLTVLCL